MIMTNNHDDPQVYDMSSYVAVAGTPQVGTMKPMLDLDLVFRILCQNFGILFLGENEAVFGVFGEHHLVFCLFCENYFYLVFGQ